jgi:TnpA family transposase
MNNRECYCLRSSDPVCRNPHTSLTVSVYGLNLAILYGKGGEFASNRLEDQEILMLSLHLLQVSLVYGS